jgi:hypothetical protein
MPASPLPFKTGEPPTSEDKFTARGFPPAPIVNEIDTSKWGNR